MGDDVLVVGGGPAGALTALLLARQGRRVRVFDRDRFPRPKLCGDTLNPGALAVLARHLDLTAIRALGQPIRGMRLSGPGGVALRGTYPAGVPGLSVTRACLDAWLIDEAVRAGVSVEQGVSVRTAEVTAGAISGVVVRGGSGEVVHRAALVVAADGRRSSLAAGLGLSRTPGSPRRWAFGAYLAGVEGVLPDFGEMHVRAGSYLGIAPVPGGLSNVCLVVPYDRAKGLMADPGRAILAAARADRAVAGRFAGARLATAPVVLGPMAVDVSTPGAPGLLLAGDAAGFVDPMTGDGLRLALRGAELTALVAADILAGRLAAVDAAADLARRRQEAFSWKWRFNRGVRALVGADRAVRAAALAARAWPRGFEAMVRYAGDVGVAAV